MQSKNPGSIQAMVCMAQRSFSVKDSVPDGNKSSKNRGRDENITNDDQQDYAQQVQNDERISC